MLSKLGFCSRSQAWELIEAGRVKLNGTICRDPERPTQLKTDRIEVDGQPVRPQSRVYLMLNKPRGLVTTAADEKGRDTVYRCFDGHQLPFVSPVGRLDQASEGLLLFTNDTAWAARITEPATHLDKRYHVQIDRVANDALLENLKTGTNDGGEHLAAKDATLLRHGERNSWIEVTLDEGRNRHIRRLLERFGIEVLRLVRVAIGSLELGTLAKGEFRRLTEGEVRRLAQDCERPERQAARRGETVRAMPAEPARGVAQAKPAGDNIALRLRVTATAESVLRSRHPWLFADSIREQNRPGRAGELAVIYDRKDQFLAIGLYDPESPIRVRILHVGKPQRLDDGWWDTRLKDALARRAALAGPETNGLRLIHGESDGWPGLVVDRYDSTLVLKLYTAAWLPRWREVAARLFKAIRPDRLVLRLSRNIQSGAAVDFQLEDGTVFVPSSDDSLVVDSEWPRTSGGVVTLVENDIRFEANVVRGQKTGFFLDQRENRQRVSALSAGRDVLNAFSFSGGFSLYAAAGGARSVTDLDISAHALESARRNFALNLAHPKVARCEHRTEQGDAFAWFEAGGRNRFDLIVLDPPSLAKREAERAGAIQAYGRLAAAALKLLRPHGILVAASCSAHVSADEFFAAVRQSARDSGRRFAEIETTAHPVDHPATFPEARYLKCIYLRFE